MTVLMWFTLGLLTGSVTATFAICFYLRRGDR